MSLKFISDYILPIIAIVAAIYIPKKLAWEQFYNDLIKEYRSIEFGRAMQNIIQFYVNTCNSDVSKIKDEYEKCFIKEIENRPFELSQSLHFDRRLLAQFFIDLEKCARSPWFYIGRKRVQKDFTKGTKDTIKILYFMGKALDESPIMFKKLTFNERVPKSTRLKGLNKYLAHLAEILKESKDYIE